MCDGSNMTLTLPYIDSSIGTSPLMLSPCISPNFCPMHLHLPLAPSRLQFEWKYGIPGGTSRGEGKTARGDQRGENCEGRTARVRGEGER